MNSFAVLDTPERDEGVRTRSKQRRKSKGKGLSEEDIGVPDVQSPKSARKKKDKGEKSAPNLEATNDPLAQPLQDAPDPSTSKPEQQAPDTWMHQEQQRGVVGQVLGWIDVKIFQYNVTFGLYMLDRWERWLFNVCAFSLIFAVSYSSYRFARPYIAASQVLLESLLNQGEAPE